MTSAWRLGQVALLVLATAGCLDQGGSGADRDRAPQAVASVIGAGALGEDGLLQVRSGSLVFLSAKDSGGGDAPILQFDWTVSDPSVVLEERTRNTVAFRAPFVAEDRRFDFTLTVQDAQGDSASDRVSVRVLAVGDLDKFLDSVDGPGLGALRDQVDFARFTLRVIPDIPEQITPGDTFSVTARVLAHHPDRNAACTDSYVTPSGTEQCLEWERNAVVDLDGMLLPDGRALPLTRESIPWAFEGGQAATTAVGLPIPPLYISLINQLLLDRGRERSALLDEWKVDSAEIVLELEVVTPARTRLEFSGPGSDLSSPVPRDVARSGRLSSHSLSTEEILAAASESLRIQSRATARAYTEAIAGDDHRTLGEWLFSRGFTHPDGTLRSEARNGQGEFAHAKYLNDFDLRFGRDMYTRLEASTGNVYSFVTNYPTLQSTLENRGRFATVVMEFSPPGGGSGDDKFTKFFVYVPDEESGEELRVQSFDFDGRGERFVPGVCVACHGGTLPVLETALAPGGYADDGDVDSAFMPWDLDSFLYPDTDPAIPQRRITEDTVTLDDLDPARRFTRAAQQDQFRKLNEHALATYNHDGGDPRFDEARDLLALWYSDPGDPLADLTRCDPGDCLSGSFRAARVPEGWSATGSDRALYTGVYAQHCRACHTLLGSALAFDTPAEMSGFSSLADLVFRTGTMPLARMTLDRLWTGASDRPAPIELLRDALPEVGAEERPGGPIITATVTNADRIDPDGDGGINSFFEVKPVSTADPQSYLTKVGRTVAMEVTSALFADASSITWTVADEAGCASSAAAVIESLGFNATFVPMAAAAAPYCIDVVATTARGSDAERIEIEALDEASLEVDASDCIDPMGTCLSFNEGEGRETLRGALADAGTAFLTIIDESVKEMLDPASVLEIEFDAPVSENGRVEIQVSGEVAEGRISFDRFVDDEIVYRTMEIGADPDLVDLGFWLFDGGTLVGGFPATIRVEPENGNAPLFQVPAIAPVPFSGVRDFSVDLTDLDKGPLDVTAAGSSEPPGNTSGQAIGLLGDLSPRVASFAQPSFPEPPTYRVDYRYFADSAQNAAPSCTSGGGPSRFFDAFLLSADDGVNRVDENLEVEVIPNFVYADVRSKLDGSFEGIFAGGNCANCHDPGRGGTATPFLDASNGYDTMFTRGLVNLRGVDAASPGDSRLLTRPEAADHRGGMVTGDAWLAVRADVLTWIQECAPEAR